MAGSRSIGQIPIVHNWSGQGMLDLKHVEAKIIRWSEAKVYGTQDNKSIGTGSGLYLPTVCMVKQIGASCAESTFLWSESSWWDSDPCHYADWQPLDPEVMIKGAPTDSRENEVVQVIFFLKELEVDRVGGSRRSSVTVRLTITLLLVVCYGWCLSTPLVLQHTLDHSSVAVDMQETKTHIVLRRTVATNNQKAEAKGAW